MWTGSKNRLHPKHCYKTGTKIGSDQIQIIKTKTFF